MTKITIQIEGRFCPLHGEEVHIDARVRTDKSKKLKLEGLVLHGLFMSVLDGMEGLGGERVGPDPKTTTGSVFRVQRVVTERAK